MNKELSKTLRSRIIENGGLVFVEKYFGMVQTIEKTEMNEEISIRKRFPVATESIVDGICSSHQQFAIPDSALKGILYFEDQGTFENGNVRSGNNFQFTSNLRLVCWINRKKVVSNQFSEITGLAINDILQKLEVNKNPRSEGMFSNISVAVQRIPIQDAQIFSKYTYDESVTQFLMVPFEFFAIDLVVKYSINGSCMNSITLNPSQC